jgi:hypothetical protein
VRLVLVHGIDQQSKSEIIVREQMLSSIRQTLGKPDLFEGIDVVAPFYGDLLAQQAGTPTIAHVVTQGLAEGDDEEREFIAAGLQQIALDTGVTDAQITAEEQDPVVAQGFPHDRRFIAIVRAIERISPLHGELALRILKQAFVYLKRPLVMQAVDSIVEPQLARGPCVVVAHSLGTVVTFKLLRALEQQVPLYITLGSPLALMPVQTALRRPRRVPQGVERWLNGVDPDDFVTLGKGLTASTFAPGIENKLDIDNGDDAHAIVQYLRDPVICRAIADAVSANP